MMNQTVELLLMFLLRAQHALEREDPEWTALQKEADRLQEVFLQRHAGNNLLIKDVNKMLDALYGIGAYQGEQSFLLGLQMGLDLGRVDRLGRMNPQTCIFS